LDERVIASRQMEEISVGDFVLSGGEIPAMALIEACVRLLPGVMGSAASAGEESFEAGLLEYPHYTRPREFEGSEIPRVLTDGNHRAIADWRLREAERLTRARRPDLWALYEKQPQSARKPGSQEQSRTTGGDDEPDRDA
jgi:tRNA (guanine37-N1)-methyltransferase